jgi:hypothetical protein
MSATVMVEGNIIREPGVFYLHVEQQIDVRVLAEEAKRRANQFVHLELSTQMHAEMPVLLVDDGDAIWRVPIHLTLPTFGDVGFVGYLHVQPLTGDIASSPDLLDELTTNAENLALRFTPDTTHTV